MSAIIGLFNRTRESLVGLDYLCEVTTGNRKPNYFTCILCDAEFENQATTLKHMTSFLHRVEYLVSDFVNKSSSLSLKIHIIMLNAIFNNCLFCRKRISHRPLNQPSVYWRPTNACSIRLRGYSSAFDLFAMKSRNAIRENTSTSIPSMELLRNARICCTKAPSGNATRKISLSTRFWRRMLNISWHWLVCRRWTLGMVHRRQRRSQQSMRTSRMKIGSVAKLIVCCNLL